MRSLCSIIITICFAASTPANATVMEFKRDGTMTVYPAVDALSFKRHAKFVSPSIPADIPADIDSIVEMASEKYGVSADLIHAMIQTESDYDVFAVSNKGAMGLMQLMPETAKEYGVIDPFNAASNVDAGTNLMSSLLKKYNSDTRLALAAYNAGTGSVSKYNGIPPYKETIEYIGKIEKNLGWQIDSKL